MIVIGLTGGIASGKSTISNIIRDLNVYVIDADIIAREVVQSGKPALEKIVEKFGEDILTKENELDRKKLGEIVFSDKKKLKILNNITHPIIIWEIKNKIQLLKENSSHKIVLIDAALLIEMEMTALVDEVWLVITKEKNQINRLVLRDGMNEIEALSRIKSQMSSREKMNYADVIIENNGDINSLKTKVIAEIRRISGASGGI